MLRICENIDNHLPITYEGIENTGYPICFQIETMKAKLKEIDDFYGITQQLLFEQEQFKKEGEFYRKREEENG